MKNLTTYKKEVRKKLYEQFAYEPQFSASTSLFEDGTRLSTDHPAEIMAFLEETLDSFLQEIEEAVVPDQYLEDGVVPIEEVESRNNCIDEVRSAFATFRGKEVTENV